MTRPDKEQISNAIIDIIADRCDWTEDAVRANMDKGIIEYFRADSLDQVEVVIGIEDGFDIEILDEAWLEGDHTPNQIVSYVVQRLEMAD